MKSGLWAFLRGLFRRPPPGASGPASAPVLPIDPQEPPVAAPEVPLEVPPAPPPEPVQPTLPLAEDLAPQASNDDGEEDEDWGGDEEDGVADDDEPDPFISGTTPSDDRGAENVEALRAQARAEALDGEHRIYLSSPAGPGSLAEALNLLLGEGAVEAQFVDEADEGPYILYRPMA